MIFRVAFKFDSIQYRFYEKKYEPGHSISYKIAYVSSEDLD